jgi:nitroreductase|tara:strand:- start:26217 stop:26867 length:651 start_codon:yes stop_codon:yes gene_type:complete
MDHKQIQKAVIRSQHCQRNWDLSKEIPEADLNLIQHAITQCPSKQNVAFYKVHMITDRKIIEAVHSHTNGFTTNFVTMTGETNSQTLANLLIVFESYNGHSARDHKIHRNDEIRKLEAGQTLTASESETFKRDQQMAVGIAAGYANVTSAMMGYSTGCCACGDYDAIDKLLEFEGKVLLMMGIGFKDQLRNRREHHDTGFMFPTKPKQKIKVKKHY